MDDFRNVHDIYDVLLRLIVPIWLNHFLEFMGIDVEIEEILKTDLTTHKGKKRYLDFLFRATNSKIYHLEFQFPYADMDDLKRFFSYNILASYKYESIVETIIINFSIKINENFKSYTSDKSKTFHPPQYHIGQHDFKTSFRNIKNKVETYIQTGKIGKITPIEELAMLLQCTVKGFENRAETLKWICEVVQYKELFDETRYDHIAALVKLELDNLISREEKEYIEKEIGKKFKEVVKVSPKLAIEIKDTINQVNKKTLNETYDDGKNEGIIIGEKIGEKRGITIGSENTKTQIYKDLIEILGPVKGKSLIDKLSKNIN